MKKEIKPASAIKRIFGAVKAQCQSLALKRKAKRQNQSSPTRSRFHVSLLDRYIIRKFIGTFVFSILLLLAVVLVFDAQEMLDAIIKAPLKDTIFQYYMNYLPYLANQFSPMFTFISVIFFTSKLADHSEIIAMLSSGISFRRLVIPYMVTALLIATFSYILAAYVIPPANVKRIEYTNKWWKNKRVDYGSNIQLQVSPGVIAYIARYDNISKTGYKFSLEAYDGKMMKSRLTAQSIQYDTLYHWTLRDYAIRDFKGLKETIRTGITKDTVIEIEPRDFLIAKNDQEKLTNPELRQYIKRQKDRGVANIKSFEIELEKRYAMVAASFLLTLIGMSLSSRKVKGGMGVNIGIGLLLSFSYILFMTLTSAFAVSGYASPRVAMWIPNILYAIIAFFLYRRAQR